MVMVAGAATVAGDATGIKLNILPGRAGSTPASLLSPASLFGWSVRRLLAGRNRSQPIASMKDTSIEIEGAVIAFPVG